MTDTEQRMKNFLLFKMYATDKEIETLAPIVSLIVIILIGGIFLVS